MEENKINLQDLEAFTQSDAFAKVVQASMGAGMEVLQDALDPKFMGLRSSTWKKIG